MKRWLASWSVNEQEPTWPQVVATLVLFLLLMVTFPALVALVKVGMS